MEMKCLDSNYIIDLLRNKPSAVKKAQHLKEQIVSTYITFFEVMMGELCIHSENDQPCLNAQKVFNSTNILELNKSAAFKAAKIGAELAKKGIKISKPDMLIAGIMLANGCKTIITNDSDFEKIPGIEVEKY